MSVARSLARKTMTGGFGKAPIKSFMAKGDSVLAKRTVKSWDDIRKIGSPVDGKQKTFNESMWEDYYTEVLDSIKDIEDYNAGQLSIIENDLIPEATTFCRLNSDNYDSDEFVEYMQMHLTDGKYEAVSYTVDACAELLTEAWDRAFGYDGVGEKMYGSYSESGRQWNSSVRDVMHGGNRVYGRGGAYANTRYMTAVADYRKFYNSQNAATQHKMDIIRVNNYISTAKNFRVNQKK
jgi:hypothetical protein